MRWMVVNEEGNCLSDGQWVSREEAELFPLEIANLKASQHGAAVIEATATEYLRFIGRLGGRKKSLKKLFAVRRNARCKRK